jgi:hypothetical protein
MKTLKEVKSGKLTLRLLSHRGAFIGIIFDANRAEKGRIQGDVADQVWRQLHVEAGKANPAYFGFKGAKARFLHFFPNGFGSSGYAGEERDYKLAAKARLDAIAPLAEAVQAAGFGDAVLAVFQATNLVSPFEKMRVKDALRGPHADTFVRAAARFAAGEITALADMERALRPSDSAKWTVATYLPFLWRPEAHMFLKPEVTKDFAERVGHGFATAYQARLDPAVYRSLLDLVAHTEAEIADLAPRDRIDVQSFIWVVGNYREGVEKTVM